MRISLALASALLASACTEARVERSPARPDGTIVMRGEAGTQAEARLALEEDARRREAQFLEAVSPGRALASTALRDDELAASLVSLPELFALGGQLFHHPFPGDIARVEGGGRPDARRCSSCHRRGGRAGSGDALDLAYLGGDGDRLSSALARRPPPLVGLAALQVLGQELSADLARLRQAVVSGARTHGARATVPLLSHGLSFGVLSASPDGVLDASALVGVAPDLIVRPFGARGTHATVQDAVREEVSRHVGAPLSNAQTTAVVAWLALGPIPVRRMPVEPDLVLAAAGGERRFEELGCASCHVPSLPLGSSSFPLAPVGAVELTADPEPPRLTPEPSGALRVWLYSDLKRHDLGPGLAEGGEDGAVFLTRPLWGVASAAPYLHDGRAPTLDEAILAHGGEAQAARDAYAALGYRERGEVRVFLNTLTRARRLTVP